MLYFRRTGETLLWVYSGRTVPEEQFTRKYSFFKKNTSLNCGGRASREKRRWISMSSRRLSANWGLGKPTNQPWQWRTVACGPRCLENGIPSKVFMSGDAVCKYFSIWDFEKENWKVPGPQYPCQCGMSYLRPAHETRRHENKWMAGGRELSLLRTVKSWAAQVLEQFCQEGSPEDSQGMATLSLLHPVGFGLWYFHCQLFLGIFFISLFISLVTFSLFKNVLFNLHVFVFFTAFFPCNWYLVS